MAEDTSRRKSNNPSRVLQSPGVMEDVDDGDGVQYQEAEVIDDDTLDDGSSSKDWYGADEPRQEEDCGRGFIFRSLDDSAPLSGGNMEHTATDQGEDLQRDTSVRSILPGRLSLRRHTSPGFSRHWQNVVSYEHDQPYPQENDTSQGSTLVRRQQRAVEPFVCRTPSSSGKKDASMQFPDDELAVLREENDELRKENAELRKKVDRLVETIALNDALPSLLASLRGGGSQSDAQSTTTTTTTNNSDANTANTMTTSSQSTITISRCQSLATDDHHSSSTSMTSTPMSPMTSNTYTSTPMPPMTSSAMTISDTVLAAAGLAVPMQGEPTMVPVGAQIPLNQVSIVDQDVLSHVSQQEVQVPRAPVLPVLAPSLPIGIQLQPPMVPPGAPSQLAMIQQSLPSQVPQTMTQTVLSHMARPILAPVRIRGRIGPKGGDKQDDDAVEITLSNHVKVDKRLLDRCNHTNFRKLTSDLLMCLFPRKTLSRSTLGGTSNSISRTTGLPTNKSRLDPNRVEAIIDYVVRVTGVPSRAVKDAIRTKLNNEAKRMHRQLIFKTKDHDLR